MKVEEEAVVEVVVTIPIHDPTVKMMMVVVVVVMVRMTVWVIQSAVKEGYWWMR